MILPRERMAIMQSLAAGVVPAIGLHHIQVGRKDEVEALIRDLDQIAAGAATCRFVIGRYGSGKTFFLNLIRTVALKRKFVVAQADITTECRLYGTGGQARALYRQLTKNLATQSKPEGGALTNILERWIGDVDHDVRDAGGTQEDARREILKRVKPLQDLVSGYDFATVVARYLDGFVSQNEQLQQAALRWLRGEFATKTEAREALGLRSIIDDETIYEYLKLLAAFVRMAGFSGLIVNVDELAVLSHGLNNATARKNNYEAILRILNDCVEGRASNIGFLFAGTNDCLEDRRRGLYSYEALEGRLKPSQSEVDGHRNLFAPVIRLESLTPEDYYVLLHNIRAVFEAGDVTKGLFPDDALKRYLEVSQQRMGAAYFQTPRDMVKDFVGLLQVLQQNSTMKWSELLNAKKAEPFTATPEPNAATAFADDDLTTL